MGNTENYLTAKIIIGANYGDEGKGLVTDLLAKEATEANGRCLGVLYNGGAQRGHTVEIKGIKRHIFHHFSSGTFRGATTYCDKDFILNPAIFVEEWDDLERNYNGLMPVVYVNENCFVTTPLDMLVNQLKESSRGENRHGSCGCGIFETIKRYEGSQFNATIGELIKMAANESVQHVFFEILLSYYEQMLCYYEENILPEFSCDYTHEEHLGCLRHFVEDLIFLIDHVRIVSDNEFVRFAKDEYDTLLFEAGQGLALDMDNTVGFPHLTPSRTGSGRPFEIVKELGIQTADIESFYVTRTYFTRHGAGTLLTECTKEEVAPGLHDKTNEPNDWQGTIRYGRMDEAEMMNRIAKDRKSSEYIFGVPTPATLCITHAQYGNPAKIIQNCRNAEQCPEKFLTISSSVSG